MYITKMFICSFVLMVLIHFPVYATSSDDLMQKFIAMLMDCAKDFPMTGDDIEELKNKRLPDTENMRCLFACAYKASGMVDWPVIGTEKRFARTDQTMTNMTMAMATGILSSFLMDDQGKLSVEEINNQAQTYFADDAEKLAKARGFSDACKSVNDVQVSDGNKGCDRAALIFECSVEKASQFGFGIL